MILSGTLLALLWAATVARLPTIWRDRRRRAVWYSVFALTLAHTAAFPPVAAHLNPVLPHLGGVVAAFFLLRFVTMVTGAGGRRSQGAFTVAVLALLVALATWSGGVGTSDQLLNGDLPGAAVAYWVVLEGYLGGVLVIATGLFWSVARAAPAGLPRLGLRTIAIGAALLAVFSAAKMTLIVAHGLGAAADFGDAEPVADWVKVGGTLLAVAGGLVPATHRVRAVAAAYRNLIVLRPLWTAMRDAFPEIILFSPRRALLEVSGVHDVHLRLYRRVIEIRDGMLALRDQLPTDVPADDDPAVTEARGIVLALHRRGLGTPPAAAPPAAAPPAAAPPTEAPGTDDPSTDAPSEGTTPTARISAARISAGWAPVGPDMADEVAWLSRVSRAYRRERGRPLSADHAPTPRPSESAR
jgi:uncharacterized protein DUF6545